jgi:hypothetical protein
MSPFDLRRFRTGRGSALASAAAVLVACSVYDDSLPQASHDLGGNGGALLGSGGTSGTTGGFTDPDDGFGMGTGTGVVDAAYGAGGAHGGDPGGGSGGAVAGTGGVTAPTGGAGGTAVISEAGAGGSVADAGADAPLLTEELIDDMEDGNNYIPAVAGRRGTWSVGNDATVGSEQTPGNPFVMTLIPNGRGQSVYAARTTGHGFTGWGAVMLVTLNQVSNDPKQSYDASGFLGITFWAKVGADAAGTYKIRIADADTLPEGKVCSGTGCNDHHQILATWSTTWTKYTYLFADMHQEGWGTPQKPFDAAHIYDVEFQTSETQPFDFWIDDLAFVKK